MGNINAGKKGSLAAFLGYAASLGLLILATLVCEAIRPLVSPTNMVMVYLIAVVLAAVRLGLRPAILTAFLGVFAFDFFFVPPRFSFSVADKEYLLTFLGLFIVGVVISSLVARARERAESLSVREAETASLYRLGRDLAASGDQAAILRAVIRNIEESLRSQGVILLSTGKGLAVAAASASLQLNDQEYSAAEWTFQSRRPAADAFTPGMLCFLPIQALSEPLGVLGIKPEGEAEPGGGRSLRLLEAFAAQIAMALERAKLSHQAQQAQLIRAREKLERALLNSVSHDLRTPLATLTGVLSSVLEEGGHLPEATRRELLLTARGEAERLNRFVGNLLDITRLEAGALSPRMELTDVQDLIGCALAALGSRQEGREIRVVLTPEMPLVPLDISLMTQVLVNILDNALKYTPENAAIELSGQGDGTWLFIEVADRGPGVDAADLERIFEKFYRVPVPEGAGGTGLGLSICRGIVEAHGGTIRAVNREGGGLRVIVAVPVRSDG